MCQVKEEKNGEGGNRSVKGCCGSVCPFRLQGYIFFCIAREEHSSFDCDTLFGSTGV